MINDIIIGAFCDYGWDKVKYWVNSIDKSGFDGRKIIIAINASNETIRKIKDKNFTVFQMQKSNNIPIHVERFIHIWNVLDNIEKEFIPRYVITTDIKDVIFQKNPCEWLEKNLKDKQLVAGSESIKYLNEPWGRQNLYETFGEWFYQYYKEKIIYNVGTFAGNFNIVKDICLLIFQMSINRPISIVDQAVYNFLLWQEPFKSITKFASSEDGWAAQLGTTYDPVKIEQFKPFLLDKIPKMIGDSVVNENEEEFTIVHQYDRVPTWKNIIEKRFS